MLRRNLIMAITLCIVALPLRAQNAKPMDNQDVIRLTRAGLSEDLIITKIKSSPTNFDTSTDGIVQLKQAGVKDHVLAVMMGGEITTKPVEPRAKSSATSSTNSAKSSAAPSATAVEDVGVYVNQSGKWKELPTEKAEWKTGGILKGLGRAAIIGGGGADVDIAINGTTSSLAAPRKSEFLLHVVEGEGPANYQLVKLTQKKDHREFKNGRSGFIGFKTGPGKAAVPFEANKLSPRNYIIKLDLEPGEYCFFKAAGGLNGDSGIVYSFKIAQ